MKVLIIGGGASGMMAALTASQNHEVILIERQSRMARKLLATGNGRCNLSNRKLSLENYHGQEPEFCQYALKYFDVEQTLDFFRRLGLLTVTEDSGRVYPLSDSANSVADVLRLHLQERSNVTIVTGCEIQSLHRNKGKFIAEADTERFEGDCTIICCGGAAGGKLGGTDLGYRLLSSFGHSRTKLYPSLVQVRTDTTLVRSLKGIRCEAKVYTSNAQNRGEVQFTDFGISGPAIFEISRFIHEGQTVTLDLLPDITAQELQKLLQHRVESLPMLKAEDLFTGMLHNRLGRTVVRACGGSLETPCKDLADLLSDMVQCIKNFTLRAIGTMGMEQAQVTAGGIKTSEFRQDTLESKLCKGLYAAGEVLDIDGDCGGYNLQWAWSSGRLAGELRGAQ